MAIYVRKVNILIKNEYFLKSLQKLQFYRFSE